MIDPFEKAKDAVREIAKQHSQELGELKKEGKFPNGFDFGEIIYGQNNNIMWNQTYIHNLPIYIKNAMQKAMQKATEGL